MADPLDPGAPPVPGSAVANPGAFRPPRIYLAAIVLGLAGHVFLPVHIMPRAAGALAGSMFALAAVGLYVSAVRTFTAAGTPVPGNQPATTIVRTGPYRFTRNPIYLAFTLLHLGVALLVNSLTVLVTLVPAVTLMSFVVIPREERYLGAKFPVEYASYRASVRRWL